MVAKKAPNCGKHVGMRAHCWALVLGDCDSLRILLCFTIVGACEKNFHLVRLNIHLHELCWQTCFGWHFLTKVKLYKRSLMCGIKSFLSLYKTFKLCKERSDVSTPRTVNIWTYNKIITNFDVTLSTPCSAILTWHLTQPNGNITLRGKCSSLKRKVKSKVAPGEMGASNTTFEL